MFERYRLGDDDLRTIFQESIRRFLFEQSAPGERPVLILVGGQPGAGKTRAGDEACREQGQPIVKIIGDDLRAYHPAYEELQDLDPADMPTYTAQASGAWVEMALRYAAQHRISALVEGTWRNPATTMGTATMFADNGFRVEAHLVAVSPEESHLSTMTRFITDERRNGVGRARFTALQAQQDAINGLPATVRALTAAGAPADRLVVQNRDQVLADKGRRSRSAEIRGVLSVLKEEQNRPLTDAEMSVWVRRLADVTDYLTRVHPDNVDVSMMLRQLGYDRTYLDARRAGLIAVRGHAKADRDVVPRVRRYPKKS